MNEKIAKLVLQAVMTSMGYTGRQRHIRRYKNYRQFGDNNHLRILIETDNLSSDDVHKQLFFMSSTIKNKMTRN
jgi:hypothetical protein